jgi:hypothetical protein
LSRFGLPGLWELIIPRSDLELWWGMKQSCSSPQDLSNGVLYSIWTHRGQVDSRLFVVESQSVSLTPNPSFDHNVCFRCLNGSCKAIFDIYTSRPFQRYKEHLKARCLTSAIELWNCESPRGFQVLTFGNGSLILTLASKWGCDKVGVSLSIKNFPKIQTMWHETPWFMRV